MRLAEVVWDGRPPGGAVDTLRSYVARLRRSVGPAVAALIVTRDPGYGCEAGDDELDVLRFQTWSQDAGTARRMRQPHEQARALEGIGECHLRIGDPTAGIATSNVPSTSSSAPPCRRPPIACGTAWHTCLRVSGDLDLFTHWVENTAHQAG